MDALTGLPPEPPGMLISITLPWGRTYTDPMGSMSCGVDAPLIIWRSTGAVGALKVALLTKNSGPAGLATCSMTRFKLTSAAPGSGVPGAAGLSRGRRLVSSKGLVEVLFCVVGSTRGAPSYLRMAELTPSV